MLLPSPVPPTIGEVERRKATWLPALHTPDSRGNEALLCLTPSWEVAVFLSHTAASQLDSLSPLKPAKEVAVHACFHLTQSLLIFNGGGVSGGGEQLVSPTPKASAQGIWPPCLSKYATAPDSPGIPFKVR